MTLEVLSSKIYPLFHTLLASIPSFQYYQLLSLAHPTCQWMNQASERSFLPVSASTLQSNSKSLSFTTQQTFHFTCLFFNCQLVSGETTSFSTRLRLRYSKWMKVFPISEDDKFQVSLDQLLVKGNSINKSLLAQSFHLHTTSWWSYVTVRHATFSRLQPVSCLKTRCKTCTQTVSSLPTSVWEATHSFRCQDNHWSHQEEVSTFITQNSILQAIGERVRD